MPLFNEHQSALWWYIVNQQLKKRADSAQPMLDASFRVGRWEGLNDTLHVIMMRLIKSDCKHSSAVMGALDVSHVQCWESNFCKNATVPSVKYINILPPPLPPK
jgi:hypothetical protein